MVRRSGRRPLPVGFVLLLIFAAAAMTAASFVDYDWTLFLSRHKIPALVEFMGQTLFEGDPPGANDPVVIYLLCVVVLYFLAWRRPRLKFPHKIRPHTGFMIVSALVGGLYIVHGLKWAVGRARPGLVFGQGWPFTPWYELGPHFITEGIYRGSFISGHTAQAFVLMAVAYSLAGDPLLGRSYKILGWVIGFLTILFSLTMGLARCMSQSHWVTDVLGALLLGWLTMHWLYYIVLRVPDQRRFWATRGHLPEMPKGWELSVAVYFFILSLGGMQVVLGLHSLMLLHWTWLALMIPLGLWLVWVAVKRLGRMLDRLAAGLGER